MHFVPVIDPIEREREIARLEAQPVATIDASEDLGSTLGEQLEILATSARMSYIALPPGDLSKTPVSLHLTDTAWGAIKVLALTYNFDMVYEQASRGHPVWRFTPVRPDELVTRSYVMRLNTHEVTKVESSGGFGSSSGSSFGSNGSQSNTQSSGSGTSGGMGQNGGNGSSTTTTNPLTADLQQYLQSDDDSKTHGFVKWISDSNTFMIRAKPKQHAEIAEFLANEDVEVPEIALDFTFVLASDSPTEKRGVDSSFLDNGLGVTATGLTTNVNLNRIRGTTLPTTVVSVSDLSATLQALSQNTTNYSILTGSATVHANRDGQIQSVTQLPIQQNTLASVGNTSSVSGVTSGQITYNPVGDIITFHAKVLDGNKVQLSCDIEVSSVTGTQNVGGQSVPVVAQQSYNSQDTTIDEGMSLGMGGLASTLDTNALKKVPGLGDIPFFGFAFKSYEHDVTRSRLYLFITPRILRHHHGGRFDTRGSLVQVDEHSGRVPFRAQPGLALSDVSAALIGMPDEIAALELAVKAARGDGETRRRGKLLVNELDLMQVTVDENRLKGLTDPELQRLVKVYRGRALEVVRNSDLPTL
jgi:type II secretory pathway component GspD/PulD (secretin)